MTSMHINLNLPCQKIYFVFHLKKGKLLLSYFTFEIQPLVMADLFCYYGQSKFGVN